MTKRPMTPKRARNLANELRAGHAVTVMATEPAQALVVMATLLDDAEAEVERLREFHVEVADAWAAGVMDGFDQIAGDIAQMLDDHEQQASLVRAQQGRQAAKAAREGK